MASTSRDDSAKTLPVYQVRARDNRRKPWAFFTLFVLSSLLLASQVYLTHSTDNNSRVHKLSPSFTSQAISKCRALNLKPGPPPTFNNRTASERFVKGTKPVLIKDAKIWTGRVQGMEVLTGDVLLDSGIVKAVGIVPSELVQSFGEELVTVDAKGAWVTPGIVDMHSHLGVDSVPELDGTSDTNSRRGPILPWLRSLDGLNTHDDAYKLSIAGGVTSALVLPGSANAIGGQGFVIKLRSTAERSPTSMLLEPPYILNGTDYEFEGLPRWRQMKHACGENPSRVYSGTRMDSIWAFRQAYDHARLIRDAQDTYCSSVSSGDWSAIANTPFPEDLQWEALVDVLRGRVKVHVHCYETVDLDDIVRLTNEFKFPIAAFHHAHETYLVPDLLKKAYGHPPTSAIFATNARYKREAYRGSEFAARILADNDLPVVMKSDHPVLNSRYLLYEAQQAHYYGLSSNLALAAVTSTPAETLGMEHRIGFLKPGYDADLVIWDSHPLSLGATPKQVYIDGIPQIAHPHVLNNKPAAYQRVPKTPDFDEETKEAVKFEGLPPLESKKSVGEVVVFENVGKVYVRSEMLDSEARAGQKGKKIVKVFDSEDHKNDLNAKSTISAIVQSGILVCFGPDCKESHLSESTSQNITYVDLQGGAIQPGLASFGSALGLEHIQGEISTKDGYVFDPVRANAPGLVGSETVVRAVDGLEFASRDALLAYKSGVTHALIAPLSRGFTSGLATAFSLSAPHKLAPGALLQEITAMHVNIGTMSSGVPSVSTQIGVLRKLVGEEKGVWGDVAKGSIPLVVSTQSLDIISSLILLKQDLSTSGVNLKLTIATASEAHLVAKELGQANVGVVLIPSRPFPETWESRRILPGPPLTQESQITQLLKHNVTVGIGILEPWSARSTRFDVGWAALESDGSIAREDAIALASSNLESLLGLKLEVEQADIVFTQGGDLLEFESKVVGVASPSRGVVDLF